MNPWIAEQAAEIAARAERELEALVGVSSPSGDVAGAEECISVVGALLPADAATERVPCSSPDHADDLIVRLPGTGTGDAARRILLLGHLDTVIAHDEHRPLLREQDRLVGSGTVDMKGGDVIALGVLRALAHRRAEFAEVALLLVCDEEWRRAPFAHAERFAGWDACLCFEAGQLTPDGDEGVIVRRKAAGTLHVRASGTSAHSGAAPERGRNALLALAAMAQAVADAHDPAGPDRLTAVPTVLHSGDAFNVVPAVGELYCDLRSDRTDAFHELLATLPTEVGGAELHAEFARIWPAMDARDVTAPLLERASERLGRTIVAASRGGASDASHFASTIPLTVDGLGPRGGGAHAPHEFVLRASFRQRAEVALALVDALL
ncbi:MAG: peptidase dimerization domain protein [Solirubrobacterales bacterium]|jgi:glutamate carboxypeptidase|nr:peptidase dimerization domain protein [Solirubrobacterales bacterium]